MTYMPVYKNQEFSFLIPLYAKGRQCLLFAAPCIFIDKML